MFTKSDFDVLFKAGDAGVLWAAMQNHTAQVESSAATAIDAEKQKQTDLLQNIAAVVSDPETETDPAILSIVAEATKDDRQKVIDAATAEIARQQQIIDSAR